MSRPETLECGFSQARLEPLVDAELGASERTRVERHLEDCGACRRRLELARHLRRELRQLPHYDTPEPVLRRVLDAARREGAERPRRWWTSWPAAAVAATVAVAVALPLALDRRQPGPPERATVVDERAGDERTEIERERIERAATEARFALAQVSRAGRRAGLEIRDGVLIERLLVPAAEGLRAFRRDDSREEVDERDEI